MNTKHTPGPWRLVTDSVGYPKHVVAESTAKVASFLTSVRNRCETEEIQANASLIIAAPELLASLVAMFEYDDLSATQQIEVERSARAAIAKATRGGL